MKREEECRDGVVAVARDEGRIVFMSPAPFVYFLLPTVRSPSRPLRP